MCFSSKKSSSGPEKPAPVAASPENAPAANPDAMQQKTAATSTTSSQVDPLGQSQLGR